MDKEMRKYFDAQFSTLKNDLSAEIGEANQSVKLLASHMDKRFDAAAELLSSIEKHLDSLDETITELNHTSHNHEKRITFIEESLPKLA